MYLLRHLEATRTVVQIYKLTYIQKIHFVKECHSVRQMCQRANMLYRIESEDFSLAKREKEKEYRDAYITNVPACRYCVMLFNVHEKRTLAATSELISIMKRNSKRNVKN